MATPVWFYEGHAWRIFTELQTKEAGWRAANVTKARGGWSQSFWAPQPGPRGRLPFATFVNWTKRRYRRFGRNGCEILPSAPRQVPLRTLSLIAP
jgi:hypothetical protein